MPAKRSSGWESRIRSTVQRSPSSTITVSSPARARARAAKAPPAPEPITTASQLELLRPLRGRRDRHLRVGPRGLVTRADRRDLGREGIGAVGEQDDRLDRVDQRRAAEAADLLQQRFALLLGGAAEGAPGAGDRESLQAQQRRAETYLRGARHARDHPPGDARDPLGIGPSRLGRQQRRRHVSQRGHDADTRSSWRCRAPCRSQSGLGGRATCSATSAQRRDPDLSPAAAVGDPVEQRRKRAPRRASRA